ncbi:MAG: xanthine dehydrogenase family protein molybdopterin-binding subunit [Acidimicrobiia bacterium]
MSILGNRVLRVEDPGLLNGEARYVEDVDLVGAAHVTYVRSPFAHARVLSVDVSAASKAPGVIAVLTAADVDMTPTPPGIPAINQAMVRPYLAGDVVRLVGEPVVALITEERRQGVDASELVFVDYDPLNAVVDLEDALSNETLLHPEAGTNVALDLGPGSGDALFEGCDVVVRQRVVNQRLAPCPLEVRGVVASWGDDGRLTFWASSQAPHGLKSALAHALGVEPEVVRVITPAVGGGFGAKAAIYTEEVLVAWIARRLGRPMRWVESRTESMLTLGHGRGQLQMVEVGGSRDGKIHAYRNAVLQDCGAYPALGAFLPFLTKMMAAGTYAIPKVECLGTSLVTNTCATVAYRGAGRPEATAAIERGLDLFAAEIGMDPAEVRRRNFIGADAFPHTTATGTTYDSGDYAGALELVLEAAGYEQLRAEQARRRDAGDQRQLGIGLASYVEITNPLPGGEYGGVEVTADGGAIVRAGTLSHGQGHATAWAMIVNDRLGIPLDRIQLLDGDTDLVRSGQGTVGSRSLQTAGVAVSQAAEVVLDKARRLAAQLLEASVDDIVLDETSGLFHVAGAPSVSRSWAELAEAAAPDGGLSGDVDFIPPGPTFPFGAHVAVIEVDIETGEVILERMITCDDSGRILNPMIMEGQRHGGIAQGVAQALMEEMVYDPAGNPVTSNLMDYGMLSAAELPSFELVAMETPTPRNELGAKGVGESGTIGATPAVQNAVVDALAHLGVRHIDMPLTSERVWRAIAEASGGAPRSG